MLRLDNEFVLARLGREHGTFPADGELGTFDFFVGVLLSNVKSTVASTLSNALFLVVVSAAFVVVGLEVPSS